MTSQKRNERGKNVNRDSKSAKLQSLHLLRQIKNCLRKYKKKTRNKTDFQQKQMASNFSLITFMMAIITIVVSEIECV